MTRVLPILVALAGCGTDGASDPAIADSGMIGLPPPPQPPVLPPPDCDADEFTYVSWTLDGAPGEVCAPADATGGILTRYLEPMIHVTPPWPAGRPAIECKLTTILQCSLPTGYSGLWFRYYNMELTTGATGPLQPEVGRAGRQYPDALGEWFDQPYVEVELHLLDDPSCDARSGTRPAYPTTGWWRVITAGARDADLVEVEAGDIDFADDAHLHVNRVFWRTRIVVADYERPECPGPCF